MASSTSAQIRDKLNDQKNIWLASVRQDGRPHLVPIWFVWHQDKIYLCIEPSSVKARNLVTTPFVSLALEDGSTPVICEGTAQEVPLPWSIEISSLFQTKYDWNITTETRYTQLVEVTPTKWLYW